MPRPTERAITQATELRSKIVQILGQDLGRFRGNILAISIGQPPASLGPATGIECLIEPLPNISRSAQTSGGLTYLDQAWSVALTNFGEGSMAGIIRALLSELPGARAGAYRAATRDAYEQYRFTVFCPGFVGAKIAPWSAPVPGQEEDVRLLTYPAATALSALRIVSSLNDQYAYADPSDADSVFAAVGLTLSAASPGQLVVPVIDREIQDSSWNWARGRPIFLGVAGTLTQVAPTTGWLLVVATPIDPDRIYLEIEEPIQL